MPGERPTSNRGAFSTELPPKSDAALPLNGLLVDGNPGQSAPEVASRR